ncbi:MAG: polymer-forming cytoskeletal protein [Patescibacteria group bacterium]
MKKLFVLLLGLLVLAPTMVFAAEFRSSKEADATVVIGKNEVLKNLYVAGNTVNVDGEIKSDLVAAGSTVVINNKIEDDLLAAGGTLNIKGDIGKNARVAGGSVSVSGKIGQDLTVAGNSVDLDKNSEIDGDLIIAGSLVNINGNIKGKVYASGEKISINGEISGDVVIKNVSDLTIGDNAKINGKLSYSSPNEANISSNASITGSVDYKEISTGEHVWKSMRATEVIYSILISFITLLVLVLMFPKPAKSVVESAFKNYWAKIGWGLLTIIIVPIASIFLMVTIIGIKLAIIVCLIYGLLLLLSTLLSPLVAGSYIIKLIKKDKDLKVDWLSALVGVVSLTLISLVPIIGWVTIVLLFLLSLGILGMNFWKIMPSSQK